MKKMKMTPIGTVHAEEDGYFLEVAPAYRKALLGLEGHSHIAILWWFSGCDNEADRQKCLEVSPYVGGPAKLGTFATRSPARPNPIALSTAAIIYLDAENGCIGLDYIDADDQSPLLDIKPYVPSLDRVEAPRVPDWCAHWPNSVEASGDFDWASVFPF